MKVRFDFVTNSSSASFIVAFARIADMGKAQRIIEKYPELSPWKAKEVRNEASCYGYGADWANAILDSVDDILDEYPDSLFVYLTEYMDAIEDWYGEPHYSYDFDIVPVITELTEENGFSDVEVAQGEGRDG